MIEISLKRSLTVTFFTLLCFVSASFAQDSDNDGLTDSDETSVYFTNPANPDTDADLIYDGDEVNTYSTNPLDNDTDNDGITDGNEVYLSKSAFIIDGGSPEDVIYDGSRFLTVWDNAWGDNDMYARFFDNNGIVSGQTFRPNSTVGFDQQDAQLAFDGTNYYIKWTDYEEYYHAGGSEWHYRYYVWGQLFDSFGTQLGDYDIILLHIHSDGPLSAHYSAEMAFDGTNYVAATGAASLTRTLIQKKTIDVDDGIYIDEFPFGGDLSLQDNVSTDIASNGSGHCMVWTSLADGETDSEITARFTPGPSVIVNTPDISWQFDPRAASNGSNYLILWKHHAGSHLELHARVYNSTGTALTSPYFVINASDIRDIEVVGTHYLIRYGASSAENAVLLDGNGTIVGSAFTLPTGKMAFNGTDCFLLGYDSTQVTGRLFGAELLQMLATRNVSFDDFSGAWRSDPLNPDTDNDGVSDGQEILNGTSPLTDDTDNDGLIDTEEPVHGTDLLNPDTDADLLTDGDEVYLHTTNPLLSDTDNDGLTDGGEVMIYGTDPLNPDTDNDTLSDGIEVNTYTTNPKLADTDNDGLSDPDEITIHHTSPKKPDTDDDLLSDYDEINLYLTSPLLWDTDSDGLSDKEEIDNSTDQFNPDTDNDGLLDGDEVNTHGSNPTLSDTDNDGLSDGDEINLYDTSPILSDTDADTLSDYDEINTYFSDPTKDDTDSDGLDDNDEITAGTELNNPDTDNDGLTDGLEVHTYTSDPLDQDTDNDGLTDGDEVLIHHSSPILTDTDNDTLNDYQEVTVYGTDPDDSDTDSDLLADNEEINIYLTDPLDTDTDDDGYTDKYEVDNGLNPLSSDTDNDGLPDREEDDRYLTDPLIADTDNDSVLDGDEFDTDNDGITDGDEWSVYETNPFNSDTDDDTLSDYDEIFTHFTSPVSWDTDNDFVADPIELLDNRINPLDNDSDNDGLVDGVESHRFSETLVFPPYLDNDTYYNISYSRDSVYDGTHFVVARAGPAIQVEPSTGGFRRSSNMDLIKLDADLNIIQSSPIDLSVYQLNALNSIKVASAGAGISYYVIFEADNEADLDNEGDPLRHLFGMAFNSSLQPIAPPQRLNDSAISYDFVVSNTPFIVLQQLTYDGSKYVVLFHDRDVDTLYMQYVSPQGILQGSNVTLSFSFPFNRYFLASNGSDYLAAWLNANHGVTASHIHVHSTALGAYELDYNLFDNRPQLKNIAFGDNGYLVNSHPGGDTNYFSFYSASGQTLQNSFSLTLPFILDIVSVYGIFLAAWNETDGVYGALFTSDGNQIGSGIKLVSWPAGDYPEYQRSFSNLSTDGDRVLLTLHESYLEDYGPEPGGGYHWNQAHFETSVKILSFNRLFAKAFGVSPPAPHNVMTEPDNPDTDNDGLIDGDEVNLYGSDPLNTDTDNDSLTDGDEAHTFFTSPTLRDTDYDGIDDDEEIYTYNTDPTLSDTDNDGVIDGLELSDGTDPLDTDTDNEGLIDGDEKYLYETDPLLPDTDNDSLTDYEEVVTHSSDPLNPDTDNDGITDGDELYVFNTHILNPDTDNDALLDGAEINTYGTDPLDNDSDNDTLTDGAEVITYGTDPLDVDTDNDLLRDDAEISTHGTDPIDSDTDADGISDGDEVISYLSDPLLPDTDADYINDFDELFTFQTEILDNDTDNDGIIDGYEAYIIIPEFQVNAEAAGAQELPAAGFDGKRFMVTWSAGISGVNSAHLYARYITEQGTFDGNEFVVNEHLPSWTWESDIASNGTQLLVAWRHFDWSDLGDFYGTIFDNDGTVKSAEFMINTYTTGRQRDIKIASNGDNFLAVWVDENRVDQRDVFAQFLDNDGNLIGPEFMVNSYTDNFQRNPVVASDGSDYLVVWNGRTEIGGELFRSDIIGRRINGDGTGSFLSGEFIVNGNNEQGQVVTEQNQTQESPDITWNTVTQLYYAVWSSSLNGSVAEVCGRFINADGTLPGAEQVIAPQGEQKNEPRVESVGSNLFVTWQTRLVPKDVYGRALNHDGIPTGDAVRLNEYENDTQDNLALTSNGREILVVWESYNQDGSGDGIFGFMTSIELLPLLSTPVEGWHKYRMNPKSADTDNDGLDDYFEVYTSFTDPSNPDIDNDGLNDYEEYVLHGTDPYNADIDGDYLIDSLELTNGTDPYLSDTDNDGLSDYDELTDYLSSPLDNDTDNDGLIDGQELCLYTPEFRINDYTPNAQSLPRAAWNDGVYLIAWEGDGGIGDTNAIMGSITRDNGQPDTADFIINTYTTNSQTHPAVAACGTHFLVTWDGYGTHDTNGIYAQCVDVSGSLTGTQLSINTITENNQINSGVASSGTNYLVVWQSDSSDGSEYDIHARFVDNEGVVSGNEFVVNQATLNDQEYPSIASAGGSYLVVWQSDDSGNSEIYARVISDNGTFQTGDFKINTYTASAQRYPWVVSDGARYLVLWEGNGAEDSAGIYGQFVTASGIIEGNQFIVNSYTASTDYRPVAASNGDYYMVAWYSYNRPGDTFAGINARYMDSTGRFYGEDFRVNSYTASDQDFPSIVSDGQGFMTLWTSSSQDGASNGAYANVLTREHTFLNGTQPEIWARYRTDMTNPDTDADTYSDYDEIYVYASSPVSIDTDSDQLTDYEEIEGVYGFLTFPYDNDSDNDGLSDYIETHTYQYGSADNERTSPLDNDSDNDALSDYDEIHVHHTDPKDADPDNDGLIDSEEIAYHSDPFLPDTDNDGLTDFEEVYTYNSDPVLFDSDNDGISDYAEVIDYQTNPRTADTDNDGLTDYSELFIYFTPATNPDSDNDGLTDGMEAVVYIDDFIVNAYTASQQQAPAVVFNGDIYLAVWESYNQDGSNYGVVGRYMDYNGAFLSGEYIINEYTTSTQTTPAAASDGTNFFIVWQNAGFSDSSGVHGILMDNEGGIITPQFNVNTTTTQSQDTPAVASNGSTYFVVWESSTQDGDDEGIYARIFDNDGNPVTGEILVNEYTTNHQQTPQVTSDGVNYLVAWKSKGQDGSDYGIYARIFDNGGNPVTGDFMVNSHTLGLQKDPYVASDGSTYLIGWSGVGSGDNQGIFARIFDNDGNSLSGDFIVNTYTANTQSFPSASSDKHGYMVAWQTNGGDFTGSSYDIVGRFIRGTGVSSDAEFLINSYTTGSQDSVRVASDGYRYFVIWETDSQDGSSTGVAASIITKDFAYVSGVGSQPWARYRSNPYAPDTDNDTLDDYAELYTHLTDPTKSDTDDDLISDADEINAVNGWQTVPFDNDTDNDGLIDGLENVYGTIPIDNDTDNDSLLDGFEAAYGTDPILSDTDADLLSDYEEIFIHSSNPLDNDTDSDTLSDYDEVSLYSTSPLRSDTDFDLLSDAQEISLLTNPVNPDMDNDGLIDGLEILFIADPSDSDTDNDGLEDGFEFMLKRYSPAINTSQPNDQSNAHSAFNGSQFLVVWESTNNAGISDTQSGIFARFLDDQGSAYGDEIHINNYTTSNQENPWVASDGKNFLVVWDSYAQDGNDGLGQQYDEVYGALVDNEGVIIKADFHINTHTAFYQFKAQAASNGTNYFVVWESDASGSSGQDGSGSGIYGQMYDNDGNKLGAEFRLNNFTAGDQANPAIVSDGNMYLATWQSYHQVTTSSYEDVYAQFYDANGTPLGSEFLINSYTTGKQYKSAVSAADDNFLIVWASVAQSGGVDSSGFGVYGRFVSPDNGVIGDEFLINTYTTNNQSNPQVMSDGAYYFVVWDSTKLSADIPGAYGQMIKPDGTFLGVEVFIAAKNLTTTNVPRISTNSVDFLVTYEDKEIYSMIYTPQVSVYDMSAGLDDWRLYRTDILNADTDNDGLSDGDEIYLFHTNPLVVTESLDTDNDGLSNDDEAALGTDPLDNDSDNDGLSDGDEVHIHLTDPLDENTDDDELTDFEEIIAGTSPISAASSFRVSGIGIDPLSGAISMGFSSVPGKTYAIHVQTGASGEFVVLYDDYTATGTYTVFVDEGGGPNGIPHPSQETAVRLYKMVVKP